MIIESIISFGVDELTDILEVVIWPITLLLIILMFRSSFRSAFDRLGSIKADATGFSATFEKKLEDTTQKFKKTRKVATPKSVAGVGIQGTTTESPFRQLVEIKEGLNKTILDLAKDGGIDVSSMSMVNVCAVLGDKKIISKENSELMQSLITLIDSARTDITQAQVDQIKALWHSI